MFAIEKAARFVALIPFVEDCNSFDNNEDMPDCWCSDDQFLTLGFGDYEEHAILLCNYFNYIDKAQNKNTKSYLVLGDGLPEGQTAYVMRTTLDFLHVEFWNSKTGECFYYNKQAQKTTFLGFTVSENFVNSDVNESIAQLKDIGCIISNDNIYINAQNNLEPSKISINLANKANWTPFLK